MLATRTVCSGINVLSVSISWICDLIMAYQNLAMKLREAFTMASERVATHAGSGLYLVIKPANHLIKPAIPLCIILRCGSGGWKLRVEQHAVDGGIWDVHLSDPYPSVCQSRLNEGLLSLKKSAENCGCVRCIKILYHGPGVLLGGLVSHWSPYLLMVS